MDVVIAEAIGIVVCLVLSAFFSGAETALTSLSTAQAQRLIEETRAHSLKLWVERPIEVLTAILIGNNIVNVTASALATDLAERLLSRVGSGQVAIPIAVGVMTFLLLTFGEITPKTIAKLRHKDVARVVMPILKVPYYVFLPAVAFFTRLSRWLIAASGSDLSNMRSPFVTAEEIQYMIDLGTREGSLQEDHERMLRSVFEFPDTVVREIMVPRTDMEVISMDMTFEEILAVLVECGHSRIPVYGETIDDIVGLFYAKDLMPLMGSKEAFDLKRYLREPYFVPPSTRIGDLLAEFQRKRIHMAIVVDEFGGTSGLITLEDIIEEFFGDIQDEYDTETAQMTQVDANTLQADARLSIWDLEEHFDVDMPEHPDYETLGGFLLTHFGKVPASGDELMWGGMSFRVLEADAKRIISVEIKRLDSLGKEDSNSSSELVS